MDNSSDQQNISDTVAAPTNYLAHLGEFRTVHLPLVRRVRICKEQQRDSVQS